MVESLAYDLQSLADRGAGVQRFVEGVEPSDQGVGCSHLPDDHAGKIRRSTTFNTGDEDPQGPPNQVGITFAGRQAEHLELRLQCTRHRVG